MVFKVKESKVNNHTKWKSYEKLRDQIKIIDTLYYKILKGYNYLFYYTLKQ